MQNDQSELKEETRGATRHQIENPDRVVHALLGLVGPLNDFFCVPPYI
jgi:hypothetical protein